MSALNVNWLSILVRSKRRRVEQFQEAPLIRTDVLPMRPGEGHGSILLVVCDGPEFYKEMQEALHSLETLKGWLDTAPDIENIQRSRSPEVWEVASTATDLVDDELDNYIQDVFSCGFCKKLSSPGGCIVIYVSPPLPATEATYAFRRSFLWRLSLRNSNEARFIAHSWKSVVPSVGWPTSQEVISFERTSPSDYPIVLSVPNHAAPFLWTEHSLLGDASLSYRSIFGARRRAGISFYSSMWLSPGQPIDTTWFYKLLTTMLKNNVLLTKEALGVDENLEVLPGAPQWLLRSEWRKVLLACAQEGVPFLREKEEVLELLPPFLKRIKPNTAAYEQAQQVLGHMHFLKVLTAAQGRVLAATGRQVQFTGLDYELARRIVAQPSLRNVSALLST